MDVKTMFLCGVQTGDVQSYFYTFQAFLEAHSSFHVAVQKASDRIYLLFCLEITRCEIHCICITCKFLPDYYEHYSLTQINAAVTIV